MKVVCFQVDSRAESVDKKIARLDAELKKYKDQVRSRFWFMFYSSLAMILPRNARLEPILGLNESELARLEPDSDLGFIKVWLLVYPWNARSEPILGIPI